MPPGAKTFLSESDTSSTLSKYAPVTTNVLLKISRKPGEKAFARDALYNPPDIGCVYSVSSPEKDITSGSPSQTTGLQPDEYV